MNISEAMDNKENGISPSENNSLQNAYQDAYNNDFSLTNDDKYHDQQPHLDYDNHGNQNENNDHGHAVKSNTKQSNTKNQSNTSDKYQSFRELSKPSPSSTNTTPTPGKKPFLRKGSRKEPSALHRVNGKMAAKKQTMSDTQGSEGSNSNNNAMRRNTASPMTSPFKENDDIHIYESKRPVGSHSQQFQSGSPTSNAQQRAHSNPNSAQKGFTTSPMSDVNEVSGTFSESDVRHLRHASNQRTEALDEFELLEQQLESNLYASGATPHPADTAYLSTPHVDPPRPVNKDTSNNNDGGYHTMNDNDGMGYMRASQDIERVIAVPDGVAENHYSLQQQHIYENEGEQTYMRKEKEREERNLSFQQTVRAVHSGNKLHDEDEEESYDIVSDYTATNRYSHQAGHYLPDEQTEEGEHQQQHEDGASHKTRQPRQGWANTPSHRGRGVHHEGSVMTELLDHSKGPMINRPPVNRNMPGGQQNVNGQKKNTSTSSGAVRRPGSAAGPRSTGTRATAHTAASTNRQAAQNQNQSAPVVESKQLLEKARELETELATYRTENNQLKSLRKQQETALNEVLKQRNEVMKWAAEERKKVEEFVTEQKALALKDRRLAAKIARTAREEGHASSIRNDKKENEALKEENSRLSEELREKDKKFKMTERRLQNVIRDQSSAIEELKVSAKDMQVNAVSLWAYLDKVGVRVPAYASASRPDKAMMYDNTSNASNNKKTGLGLTGILQNVAHGSSERRPAPAAPKTFNNNRTSVVEEVALEEVQYSPEDDVAAVMVDSLQDAREPPRGALANALFSTGRTASNNTASDSNRYTATSYLQGIDAEPEADSLFVDSANYDPKRYHRNGHTMTDDIITGNAHMAPEQSQEQGSQLAYMNDTPGVRESWARSSRSSRGSRYSSSEAQEDREYEHQETHVGDEDEDEDEEDEEDDVDNYRLPTSSFTLDFSSGVGKRSPVEVASSNTSAPAPTTSSNSDKASREEEVLSDGRKRIRYRNGTTKEVMVDGSSTVYFLNGDTKTTRPEGTVVYYYAEAKTYHTTHRDGLEVYEFPNKQVHHHHSCYPHHDYDYPYHRNYHCNALISLALDTLDNTRRWGEHWSGNDYKLLCYCT